MGALMPLMLFGGGIGYGEIALIAFVALLIFGRRLPEVGRSLGKGIKEFKKGIKGIEDDIDKEPEPEKSSPPDDKAADKADDKAAEEKADSEPDAPDEDVKG